MQRAEILDYITKLLGPGQHTRENQSQQLVSSNRPIFTVS